MKARAAFHNLRLTQAGFRNAAHTGRDGGEPPDNYSRTTSDQFSVNLEIHVDVCPVVIVNLHQD